MNALGHRPHGKARREAQREAPYPPVRKYEGEGPMPTTTVLDPPRRAPNGVPPTESLASTHGASNGDSRRIAAAAMAALSLGDSTNSDANPQHRALQPEAPIQRGWISPDELSIGKMTSMPDSSLDQDRGMRAEVAVMPLDTTIPDFHLLDSPPWPRPLHQHSQRQDDTRATRGTQGGDSTSDLFNIATATVAAMDLDDAAPARNPSPPVSRQCSAQSKAQVLPRVRTRRIRLPMKERAKRAKMGPPQGPALGPAIGASRKDVLESDPQNLSKMAGTTTSSSATSGNRQDSESNPFRSAISQAGISGLIDPHRPVRSELPTEAQKDAIEPEDFQTIDSHQVQFIFGTHVIRLGSPVPDSPRSDSSESPQPRPRQHPRLQLEPRPPRCTQARSKALYRRQGSLQSDNYSSGPQLRARRQASPRLDNSRPASPLPRPRRHLQRRCKHLPESPETVDFQPEDSPSGSGELSRPLRCSSRLGRRRQSSLESDRLGDSGRSPKGAGQVENVDWRTCSPQLRGPQSTGPRDCPQVDNAQLSGPKPDDSHPHDPQPTNIQQSNLPLADPGPSDHSMECGTNCPDGNNVEIASRSGRGPSLSDAPARASPSERHVSRPNDTEHFDTHRVHPAPIASFPEKAEERAGLSPPEQCAECEEKQNSVYAKLGPKECYHGACTESPRPEVHHLSVRKSQTEDSNLRPPPPKYSPTSPGPSPPPSSSSNRPPLRWQFSHPFRRQSSLSTIDRSTLSPPTSNPSPDMQPQNSRLESPDTPPLCPSLPSPSLAPTPNLPPPDAARLPSPATSTPLEGSAHQRSVSPSAVPPLARSPPPGTPSPATLQPPESPRFSISSSPRTLPPPESPPNQLLDTTTTAFQPPNLPHQYSVYTHTFPRPSVPPSSPRSAPGMPLPPLNQNGQWSSPISPASASRSFHFSQSSGPQSPSGLLQYASSPSVANSYPNGSLPATPATTATASPPAPHIPRPPGLNLRSSPTVLPRISELDQPLNLPFQPWCRRNWENFEFRY